MKVISIDKVVINVGVGSAGEELEKAKAMVERISGQKAIITRSKKRIPTWGIRKKMPIGVKVTVRKDKADKFLRKALEAADNQIKARSISDNGVFSFGIKEYIDLPGVKYDPDIGIFGFDVCVNLKKWGYRISLRKMRTKKIPKRHRITKEDVEKFLEEKYNVKVIE